MYFDSNLYDFFCDQKLEGYFIKGKRGLIRFNLETSYTKKKNLYSELEYSFGIFSAYSPRYLKRLGLPGNTEEDSNNLHPIKIPEELINKEYFLRKKEEKKEVIDIHIHIKYQEHDVSINTGLLDEDEDISVLEKLGYNTKMPPQEEIENEFLKFNLEKIYNVTLPFSNQKWLKNNFIGGGTLNFFTGIKNLLEANAGEIFIAQPEYFKVLSSLGDQGLEYNIHKKLSLKKLEEVREIISSHDVNPLTYLVRDLVASLGDTIINDKKIIKCQNCERYIEYGRRRKYCSYIKEGRDCGKSARNKRAYLRRKIKDSKKKHLLKNTKNYTL